MTTTKKTKVEKKENDGKPVGVDDYKGENDEEMEGEIPAESEIDKSKIESVEKAKIDIETTEHFDAQTDAFKNIIENLPSFSQDDERKIAKHYADKRAAWELSHVNDSAFPIRFKVLESEKDGFAQYKTEIVKEGDKQIQKFKYEEIYYQGQSITPSHKDKIIQMENQEALLFSKLDRIDMDIQNIATIRNTIGAIMTLANKEQSSAKVTQDELKAYMKRLDEAIKKLPDNIGDAIRKIKDDADKITREKNQFLAYAYFSIDKDKYPHAILNDIRDYIGVIQRRDNLKVPT